MLKLPNKFSTSEKKILIKGARVHNLNNVDVELPKNKFIVITGVSGSGKSSLTIDTLFAEGQRRYVESLSSYARQFLTRLDKPDVDYIKGLCPAIAIEQKVSTRTTRSTVGSLTELYDYLRLLFARVGKTYSPKTGELVTKHEVKDVVDFIFKLNEGEKVFIYFEQKVENKLADELKLLLQKGFTRVNIGDEIAKVEELLENKDALKKKQTSIKVLVDRLVVKYGDEDLNSRVGDSVQTAFSEGHGQCIISPLTPEGGLKDKTANESLGGSSPFGGQGAAVIFSTNLKPMEFLLKNRIRISSTLIILMVLVKPAKVLER